MPRLYKLKSYRSSTSDIFLWERRRARLCLWLQEVRVGEAPEKIEVARTSLFSSASTADAFVFENNRNLWVDAWETFLDLRPKPRWNRVLVKDLGNLGYALSYPHPEDLRKPEIAVSMPWLDRLAAVRRHYLTLRGLYTFDVKRESKRSPKQVAAASRAKVEARLRRPSPAGVYKPRDPAFDTAVDAIVAETERRMALDYAPLNGVESDRCG
jgi:hypothetical protein